MIPAFHVNSSKCHLHGPLLSTIIWLLEISFWIQELWKLLKPLEIFLSSWTKISHITLKQGVRVFWKTLSCCRMIIRAISMWEFNFSLLWIQWKTLFWPSYLNLCPWTILNLHELIRSKLLLYISTCSFILSA